MDAEALKEFRGLLTDLKRHRLTEVDILTKRIANVDKLIKAEYTTHEQRAEQPTS